MPQRLKMRAQGFTIVELLIVIVVIAILAAITIVGYNGVTARANDAVARADVSNLAKNFQLFRLDAARYPIFLNGEPAPELEQVLRQTNLWNGTRAIVDPVDSSQFKISKSFIFCVSPNNDQAAIVAMAPITTGLVASQLSNSVGKKLIYYLLPDDTFRETTFKHEVPGQDSAVNVCKSVIPAFDYTTWSRRWSFDTPTLKAQ